jgi:hypothetical protein
MLNGGLQVCNPNPQDFAFARNQAVDLIKKTPRPSACFFGVSHALIARFFFAHIILDLRLLKKRPAKVDIPLHKLQRVAIGLSHYAVAIAEVDIVREESPASEIVEIDPRLVQSLKSETNSLTSLSDSECAVGLRQAAGEVSDHGIEFRPRLHVPLYCAISSGPKNRFSFATRRHNGQETIKTMQPSQRYSLV